MPEPPLSAALPLPRRRLTVVAAALVGMAAAGVFLIVGAQGSSGAPVAEAAASRPPSAATTAPPPDSAASLPGPPADQSSVSPDSEPAPAAKPPAPLRPRPPATPAPTAAGPGAPDSAAQLEQVQAIADTSGWDWRKVHVQFKIGFDPEACCHWGVYDPQDHKTIWIGPTAFGDATRIRYVVLHELAHAWQWHSHRLKKLSADMAPWGYSDLDALEAGADCIAADWGAAASSGHYWVCPPDAQALMAKRLAGQWK